MILLADLARMAEMQNTAEKYEGDDEKVALIEMVRLIVGAAEARIAEAVRVASAIGDVPERTALLAAAGETRAQIEALWSEAKRKAGAR